MCCVFQLSAFGHFWRSIRWCPYMLYFFYYFENGQPISITIRTNNFLLYYICTHRFYSLSYCQMCESCSLEVIHYTIKYVYMYMRISCMFMCVHSFCMGFSAWWLIFFSTRSTVVVVVLVFILDNFFILASILNYLTTNRV